MNTEVYWQESKRQWNIPNALTYSRAFCGIMLPLFWLGGTEWLAFAIVYAGVSDGLDGWLARKLKAETPIGAVIDPLADKIFTDLFLLGLAFTVASVPFALLAIVTILYDIDNTYQRRSDIARAFRGIVGAPSKPVTWVSKTKTAVLFLLMIFALYPEWLLFVTLDALVFGALLFVVSSWLQSRQTTIKNWYKNVTGTSC
jgi:phosphatidylglycerophosphate synthase